MNTPTDASLFSSLHAPWDSNDNVIWLASTIKLSRNIEKFHFAHKLATDRKKQLLSLILNAFSGAKMPVQFTICKAELLQPTEKEFLIEHFLLSDGLQEARVGAAVGFDTTGTRLILFNCKDHITLQKTDVDGTLEKSLEELVTIENAAAEELNFAFSEKYGFLTTDPLQCGTGCSISCFLHVPGLIHTATLTSALEKEKCEAVVATGLLGNPDEFLGDIVVLKNLYTLGVTEENTASTMQNAVLHFVLSEKEARRKIRDEKTPAIVDMILRAVGLLKYSYVLEVPETLNALSLIKLGLEIGWLKGIKNKEINRLFFDCRRSHLRAALSETVDKNQIVRERAEYLRRAVATLELCIEPKN